MPWEIRTVEKQRIEFVFAALNCNNFSALCREYGITRKTGYKWLNRAASGEPVSDMSRRPLRSPNRTSSEVEGVILAIRSDNPGWGAKKIHQTMQDKGYTDLPCVKTVNNILNRNGCISEEESQKRKPYTRFEKENCNDLWQGDFKGEFKMADSNYCYTLDLMDDHSRFVLKITPSLSTVNLVIPTFMSAFREYGLPNAILTDNGGQFAGFRKGYTQFEKLLMDLDILPIHGRIKHPQTQGKIERFHRTMKNELLKHTEIEDIEDAERKLREWGNKYNYERPHEALNMKRPGDIYVPSERKLPKKIKKYEYGGGKHVIKVNSWGYVRYGGWQIYLSETMRNEYIEFRPSEDGERFYACYRNYKIAEFDTANGQLIRRHISRL